VTLQQSRNRNTPWPFLAIAALTAVWLAASKTPDFHVYWRAGAALRTDGWTAVYQISQLASFKYHPFFALILTPIGLLSEPAARVVWALLNALLVFDLMRRWQRHWRLDAAAIALGFLCVGHALFWQYAYGNVAFVMLWLWTVALTTPSQWRSALCYAVLIALKPFWLALLVPWLLCRRFDLMVRVTVAISALSVVPIVLGINGMVTAYQRWFATFADPAQGLNYQAHENQSWYGLLFRHRDVIGTHVSTFWLAGAAVVGIAWLWQWRSAIWTTIPDRSRWTMELSLAPFILWTAPLSWIHHQILLWPLLAVAWQLGRTSALARVTWIASFVLLTGLSESIIGRQATLLVLEWGVALLALLLLNWWASAARLRAASAWRTT